MKVKQQATRSDTDIVTFSINASNNKNGIDVVTLMDIESRVWIKISGEKPWQKGVISHIVTLEVNKLTSCIKKNFKFYIQDNSTGEFTGEAGEISSWSLEGLDDEFEYVKLRNMNESEDVSKVDDLVTLSYLHEPAILICLRSRFEQDLIYTNTGPILIALNPFKKLSIYSPEVVAYYRQSGEQRKYGLEGSHTPPHVYKIADNAFRQMVNSFYDGDSDQSILVSGESGSGKTETTKFIMKYLADITTSSSSSPLNNNSSNNNSNSNGISDIGGIEQQILQSNPILESFGNARTLRNDNSSRFGKFLEINFVSSTSNKSKFQLRICGATIRTYLLEKVRLVHQSYGERNYHCFYETIKGSTQSEKVAMGLTNVEDFRYINQSSMYTRLDGVDDNQQFQITKNAMTILKFSEDEKISILNVVAAILHIGNLVFELDNASEGNEEGSRLSKDSIGEFHREFVCNLLGISNTKLENVLCNKLIKTPEATLTKRLTVEEAEYSRDALSKSLFGALFDYLVNRINSIISSNNNDLKDASNNSIAKMQSSFIGVLDIFGFESFETNSFEQLCINYTNETLQQHFNRFVFKHEQQLYEDERISWKFIVFPDNSEVIDLMESKMGIFAICEEQARFPRATDITLVNKFYEHCSSHPRFYAGPSEKGKYLFVIKHYAGAVTYYAQSFLEKNNDVVRADMIELLNSSQVKLVREICQFFRTDDVEDLSKNDKGELTRRMSVKVISRSASGIDAAISGSTPNRRGSMKSKIITLSGEFRGQLGSLMESIQLTTPHYIRCIKPNNQNVRDVFEENLIVDQLRCGGVLESIKVSRAGYPVRHSFNFFLKLYGNLVGFKSDSYTSLSHNELLVLIKQVCQKLAERALSDDSFSPSADAINQSNSMLRAGIQCGKSKVFLRRKLFDYLEMSNHNISRMSVIKIQSKFRSFVLSKQWKIKRLAILSIQCSFRCFVAKKKITNLRKLKAIMLLQRVFRGHMKRLYIYRLIRSIICIQCFVRMVRAKCVTRHLREDYNVQLIQCIYRRYKARKHFLKIKDASTLLQSIIRKFIARRKYIILLRESKSLAAVIEERNKIIQKCAELEQSYNSLVKSSNIRQNLIIYRASQCLNLSEEDTIRLLTCEDDNSFKQMREKYRASYANNYENSPAAIMSHKLSDNSEIDSIPLLVTPFPSNPILPNKEFTRKSLPPSRASGDPLRHDYIKIMHELLVEAISQIDEISAKEILGACPKALTYVDNINRSRNAMHVACASGVVDIVELFLRYNPPINAQDADGNSYLHLTNNSSIVQLLCNENIDTNICDRYGKTALHKYVAVSNYDCAKIILRHGADPNTEDRRSRRTPLQIAAVTGNYKMLSLLFNESVVKCKVDKLDFDGNSLLHLVTLSETSQENADHIKCIMLLLDKGCSAKAANIKGATPLHFLCGNIHLCHKHVVEPIAEFLLSLSANANAKDDENCTPLIIATAHREWGLCRLLLEHGGDMNISCPMNSALLRRGEDVAMEGSIQEYLLIEECTASDLLPRSARAQVFPSISSLQTMMDPATRSRCMNCAVAFSDFDTSVLGVIIVSGCGINCAFCGRLVCENCLSKSKFERSDVPQFLRDGFPDTEEFNTCIVCCDILRD